MNNKLTIEENLSLILQTKTQFKNDIKDLGGSINDNTPFSDYPPIYKQIAQSGGGGSGECVDSGYAIEVSTHEEMDALLVDSNLNKLYKFVGTSDDTYVNGMIYMVVESDTTIPSGVGATLNIEGGYKPVPIGEVVDKVIFNTSVSNNDVKNILSKITFSDPNTPFYVVYANSVADIQLGIADYGIALGTAGLFFIAGILQGTTIPVWVDPQLSTMFDGLSGWNYEGFASLGGNSFPLGFINESTYVDDDYGTLQVGLQNDILAEIINIGEKVPEKKQLKGDYYAVSINSINNGRLDLMNYINKNQIPTKININVPDVPPILQELEFYPDRFYHEYEPEDGYDGFSKVITRGVDSNVDSNIQPNNIKKGVWILGTLGTLEDKLRLLLNGKKSTKYLFLDYEGSSIDDIFSEFEVTSAVVDMSNTFENSKIQSLPNINTSSVTNMCRMFYGCSELKTISSLYTGNVTNMQQMFYNCSKLSTLPKTLDTQNVTNMDLMFYYCQSLREIPYMNTSKITNMARMFYRCGLDALPMINTSNVTNMEQMFYYCMNLEIVPQIDTSKVTNMNMMFINCASLVEVPELDTSNVTDMGSMFKYSYNLRKITKLNMINVTNTSDMLWSTGVQDVTLINLKTNLTMPNSVNLASLINTCKECINVGTNKKLTIGTENMEKIANTYVRLTNQPEEDASNPKLPMIECQSTDDGAMTISEYMALKNWTLA